MYFMPLNSGQPYTVLSRNGIERARAEGNGINFIFKENMLICRVDFYLLVVLTHSLQARRFGVRIPVGSEIFHTC